MQCKTPSAQGHWGVAEAIGFDLFLASVAPQVDVIWPHLFKQQCWGSHSPFPALRLWHSWSKFLTLQMHTGNYWCINGVHHYLLGQLLTILELGFCNFIPPTSTRLHRIYLRCGACVCWTKTLKLLHFKSFFVDRLWVNSHDFTQLFTETIIIEINHLNVIN
jgi:hypothetical protein